MTKPYPDKFFYHRSWKPLDHFLTERSLSFELAAADNSDDDHDASLDIGRRGMSIPLNGRIVIRFLHQFRNSTIQLSIEDDLHHLQDRCMKSALCTATEGFKPVDMTTGGPL